MSRKRAITITITIPLPVAALLASTLVGLTAVSAADAQHHHHHDGHVIAAAEDLIWTDAPPSLPPGARVAVVAGNPEAQGAFVMRAMLPAGYVIPPHWHTGVERVTVLSGRGVVGMGERIDPATERRLGSGSYFSMTRGVVHYMRADAEMVLQIHGVGPWGIVYPDRANDPRGAAAPPVGEGDLAAIRRATLRFQDVGVALAEGYIPDPTGMCITSAMEGLPRQDGAMGIHYFRPDFLGIAAVEPRVSGTGVHTDFTRPGILIYEPQADGTLELVAIENLVWAGPWRAAGNTGMPAFMGNEYYPIIDNPLTLDVDEAHGFEPHFELHMWLFRENPNGLFTPFNPAVTCDHHRPAH